MVEVGRLMWTFEALMVGSCLWVASTAINQYCLEVEADNLVVSWRLVIVVGPACAGESSLAPRCLRPAHAPASLESSTAGGSCDRAISEPVYFNV